MKRFDPAGGRLTRIAPLVPAAGVVPAISKGQATSEQSYADNAGAVLAGGSHNGVTATYNASARVVDLLNTDRGTVARAAHEAATDPHAQYHTDARGDARYPLQNGSGATGTWGISISGNSATATALATGRTIGITGDLTWTSPSFDGSGSVTAAGTLATVNDSPQTDALRKITVNGKGLVTATSAVVASDIPLLNQNTTGSAATLTTGRTFSLTGDATGTSAAFNGSANASIPVTLSNVVTAASLGLLRVAHDAKGRITTSAVATASDIGAVVDSRYLLKSGDTAVGSLSVAPSSADAGVLLNGPSGFGSYLHLRSGGSTRWVVGRDTATESGGNAGSNFFIQRHDDAGSFLSRVINIYRATGDVGIGASPFGQRLLVAGESTGGTSRLGVETRQTIQSDVTSSYSAVATGPSTAAASFTLTSLTHYNADQGTFGAGSAVTFQYGFRVQSNMVGGTNNYAFSGEIPAGSNRWNLFMGGTAVNYLAGALRIGSTLDGFAGNGMPNLGVHGTSFSTASAQFNRFSADNDSSYLIFGKSRAGAVGSYTAVSPEDALGRVIFSGADGTQGCQGAQISAAVDGTPSAGIVPGRLTFLTSPVATGTPTERVRIDQAGNVGIGTTAPTALLDINSNTIRVRTARTPASSSAAGNAGDICWDSTHMYICVAANTWRRIAHSTW